MEYGKSLTSTHVTRSQLWQHSSNQHSPPEQQNKVTAGLVQDLNPGPLTTSQSESSEPTATYLIKNTAKLQYCEKLQFNINYFYLNIF